MNLKNNFLRIYVTQNFNYDYENNDELALLKKNLNLKSISYFKKIIIYEIYNYDKNKIDIYIQNIFAPKNYYTYTTNISLRNYKYFAFEHLPNVYNKNENACINAINLYGDDNTIVKVSWLCVMNSNIKDEEFEKIKKYFVNKSESRIKNINSRSINKAWRQSPRPLMDNFLKMNAKDLYKFYKGIGFSISFDNFLNIQKYFMKRKTTPRYEEIKFFDIFWSDHCRHTTFSSNLTNIKYKNYSLQKIVEKELNITNKLLNKYNFNNLTLMNITQLPFKEYESKKVNTGVEKSEEINSCAINVVNNNNYYFIFKNETHNHPTEIEPIGGASTCLGGAIRDVFANRAHILGGIRLSGCANLSSEIKIKSKLSQSYISFNATKGFSGYGNELGIPTTYVDEIYDESYVSKHFECGAVYGITNKDKLKKDTPKYGDYIVLLGNRTGIDGIGGASGSSKPVNNNEDTVGLLSEVQRGNSIIERNILRIFKDDIKFNQYIKRCNDLGAGGISVGVIELFNSMELNLDQVKIKYSSIDSYEILFSESQERMVVVIDPKNYKDFVNLCYEENIEACAIGKITNNNKIIVKHKNKTILNLDYNFIKKGIVRENAFVLINEKIKNKKIKKANIFNIRNELTNLNNSVIKGLVETFDFSINQSNMLFPYSGKYKLTKERISIIKLPIKKPSFAVISTSFDTYYSKYSSFHLGMNSVIGSISKFVAKGYSYKSIYFSFQEYFKKIISSSDWSLPLLVLLGANKVLRFFNLCNISGKDSMSGTYKKINVISTFVSFAFSTYSKLRYIPEEFKNSNSYIYMLNVFFNKHKEVDLHDLKNKWDFYLKFLKTNDVISSSSTTDKSLISILVNKSIGNNICFDINYKNIFEHYPGNIVFTLKKKIVNKNFILLGKTTNNDYCKINNIEIKLKTILFWINKNTFSLYPYYSKLSPCKAIPMKKSNYKFFPLNKKLCNILILVFPGTNCEYDMENAFNKYKNVNIKKLIINNINIKSLQESVKLISKNINNSDIIAIPGGFSFEDEPNSSAIFIANILNLQIIKNAINNHLKQKKLIIGICNGFQALIKSGLLLNENITINSPNLVKNDLKKHISTVAKIKYLTNSSPWIYNANMNKSTDILISNTEGKLMISTKLYKKLKNNSQILSQFTSEKIGKAINYSSSYRGIEGLISNDGLILGRMGHSERYLKITPKNIKLTKNCNIFKNGIKYILGENFEN